MLLSVLVLPFILGTIGPLLNTATMLLIFYPFANIRRSISMFVCPMTMCLIVLPRPFVNITVCVNKDTMTICLIILPLSVIFTAILPDLLTVSVLEAMKKLTSVNCSVTERYWSVILSLIIVHHFASNS